MCRGAALLFGAILGVQLAGNPCASAQTADGSGTAQQHFDAGVQFQKKHDPGSTRQAISEFHRAADLWLAADDRAHAGAALESAGRLSYFAGDYRAAQADLERAAGLSREAKDDKAQAAALYGLARVYLATGDAVHGVEAGEQVLSLRRRLRDRSGEGAALQDLGWAYFLLGDNQRSFTSYQDALAIREGLKDDLGVGLAQYGIGSVYWAWGESEKAIEAYEHALASYRTAKYDAGVANTLNSAGLAYADIGEYRKATEMYAQAQAIWERLKQTAGEVLTLNNLGLAYAGLEEPEKAIGFYDRALKLADGPDTRPRSYILQNLGDIYARLKRYTRALDYYRQSLELKRTAGDRFGEAYTLTRLGEVQSALGDSAQATASLEEALKLDRFVGARGGEAAALAAMAHAMMSVGKPDNARSEMQSAIGIVESLFTGLSSHDLRTTFFANQQSYYRFYIDVLMHLHRLRPKAGYDREALEVAERSRARTLLDSLAEARAQIHSGVAPELVERERTLRSELHGRSQRLESLASGHASETELRKARANFDDALRSYNELDASIRTSSPRYAALVEPQPLTVAEIQQRVLDSGTVLLEYSLGAEHSYAWLVSKDGITTAVLPSSARIEAMAHSLYQDLNARNQNPAAESIDQNRLRVLTADAAFDRTARQLSALLIDPFASRLGTRRLVIVPDGALQYVPFAALPRPGSGQPMVMRNEVVALPSASTIAVLRDRTTARASRNRIAIIADPVFDSSDARLSRGDSGTDRLVSTRSFPTAPEYTRLRFSRTEADDIAALEGKTRVRIFRDFDANRDLFFNGSLRGYGTLHIASHTVIDNERPALSRIVLSGVDSSGKSRDGYLRLFEIYNLDLDADLVVLSACRTALGREVRGEGLVGLTRGFFYAGASRVVASLWSVRDQATAELMRRFYEHLVQGRTPAAALCAAEREMAAGKRWANPYYWAAFTLQGDWN
jgi:CHAT domain-containing protein/tetratricopeptide (TPR) repeat protein